MPHLFTKKTILPFFTFPTLLNERTKHEPLTRKTIAAAPAALLALPLLPAYAESISTSISGQSANDFATDLKLAKQGYAVAQNNVGMRYFQQQNYAKALLWLQKSAAQGDEDARENLQYMNEHNLR